MGKRLITTLLVLLTIGVQAFAQSAVSGKVTDKAGEPLVGVNVLVKGTNAGTMTDLDGNWTIANVESNAVIVFSSIGFSSREVTVGTKKVINVVLEDDTNFLDEVVVVGYGTARRRDLSGSIASVNYANDKNISTLPNPNALSALSSKVAGFSYAPTSSAAGDNTGTMTIRGKNSIPSSVGAGSQSVNQPMLVIDGVISYGSINSVNTSDIESIDVLKDASAAAIYGSRAANGVIIITTKRGTSAKPVVSFNASVSLSDWTRMPKMVTDDETFLKNRFDSYKANNSAFKDKNWADYSSLETAATELMSDVELAAFKDGTRTNWIKEISRTGVGQKYDLSIAGKSKNIAYYVSGDYTRQQGIRLGDDYEKYNFLAKLDMNVNDWLTVGVKVSYLGANSWGQTARIQNATWMSPYSYVMVQTKGYENWYNYWPDGKTASPLVGAGKDDSYLYTDRSGFSSNANGIAYAQIDFPFLKGLSYRITVQGQHNTGRSDVFNNPELWVDTNSTADMDNPSKYNGNAEGSSGMSYSQTWNVDNILTYTKDIKDHHFDLMVGYTREKYNSEGLNVQFKGFSSPTYLGVYKMDVADNANTILKRSRTTWTRAGYLARANYNFKNTYYASAVFRRDGYSGLAEGYKWDNFYGASAAWVLSNERFIKDLGWFDFLKFRASWGQNGASSVSPYQTLATVGVVGTRQGSMSWAWLGNQGNIGIEPFGIPNRSLTWATVEKMNFGLDFTVLNGRLSGNIDGYTGRTTNMIVSRSAPYMTGFKSIYDNVGLVTNNGIEITLNSVNINGDGDKTFRWTSSIVFDSNTNCVKELYGKDYKGVEADDVANAVAYGFDSYYALQVGHPIGSAYDLKKLGIFNSDEEVKGYVNSKGEMIQPNAKAGDIKFEDWNNDGVIDEKDRHFLGSPDPLFTMNIGNTLSWKNFSLYFNFRWAQGNDTHFIWFDPHAFKTNQSSGAQLAAVDPWTETNHSQKYPKRDYNNTLNYQFWNTRSFLKLKDLSLSYTVDPNLLKKVGLGGARVYVAATDLFTITGWSGLDPETGGTIAGDAGSSRFGSNGTYKTVTFGVNLTF